MRGSGEEDETGGPQRRESEGGRGGVWQSEEDKQHEK